MANWRFCYGYGFNGLLLATVRPRSAPSRFDQIAVAPARELRLNPGQVVAGFHF